MYTTVERDWLKVQHEIAALRGALDHARAFIADKYRDSREPALLSLMRRIELTLKG